MSGRKRKRNVWKRASKIVREEKYVYAPPGIAQEAAALAAGMRQPRNYPRGPGAHDRAQWVVNTLAQRRQNWNLGTDAVSEGAKAALQLGRLYERYQAGLVDDKALTEAIKASADAVKAYVAWRDQPTPYMSSMGPPGFQGSGKKRKKKKKKRQRVLQQASTILSDVAIGPVGPIYDDARYYAERDLKQKADNLLGVQRPPVAKAETWGDYIRRLGGDAAAIYKGVDDMLAEYMTRSGQVLFDATDFNRPQPRVVPNDKPPSPPPPPRPLQQWPTARNEPMTPWNQPHPSPPRIPRPPDVTPIRWPRAAAPDDDTVPWMEARWQDIDTRQSPWQPQSLPRVVPLTLPSTETPLMLPRPPIDDGITPVGSMPISAIPQGPFPMLPAPPSALDERKRARAYDLLTSQEALDAIPLSERTQEHMFQEQAIQEEWNAMNNNQWTQPGDRLPTHHFQGTGRLPKGGLSTKEIDKDMNELRPYGFLGTIAWDEMSKLPVWHHNRSSWVMNLDRSDQKGSHWVGVFLDARPDGAHAVEYFDSYGDPPTPEIETLLRQKASEAGMPMATLKVNGVVHQHEHTDTCGIHAMHFVRNRTRGIPFAKASGYDQAKQKEGALKNIRVFKKYF